MAAQECLPIARHLRGHLHQDAEAIEIRLSHQQQASREHACHDLAEVQEVVAIDLVALLEDVGLRVDCCDDALPNRL